jgi:hypothetical protein
MITVMRKTCHHHSAWYISRNAMLDNGRMQEPMACILYQWGSCGSKAPWIRVVPGHCTDTLKGSIPAGMDLSLTQGCYLFRLVLPYERKGARLHRDIAG